MRAARTLILAVLFGCLVTGQLTGQRRGASPPPQAMAMPDLRDLGVNVVRTATGDFEVTYRVGSAEKTWTFVPASKIEPSIESEITRNEAGRFVYSYSVSNGRTALQDLVMCEFPVIDVENAVVENPPGWNSIAVPQTGRVAWLIDSPSETLQGMAPGIKTGGFRVTSGIMPGPVEARCKGNVELEIPTDLPPAAYKRLEQSGVFRNSAMTMIMAPRISSGGNEPELTAATLTSRVMAAYASALGQSKHPGRLEIADALTEALIKLPSSPASGRQALDRAKGLAMNSGANGWARSLGGGLAACIDRIKEKFKP